MKTTNKLLFTKVLKQPPPPSKTSQPISRGSLPLKVGDYSIGLDKLFTVSTAKTTDGWLIDRATLIAYHRNKLP